MFNGEFKDRLLCFLGCIIDSGNKVCPSMTLHSVITIRNVFRNSLDQERQIRFCIVWISFVMKILV